jgi:hypothetical protein
MISVGACYLVFRTFAANIPREILTEWSGREDEFGKAKLRRVVLMGDFCDHGNEHLGFIKFL